MILYHLHNRYSKNPDRRSLHTLFDSINGGKFSGFSGVGFLEKRGVFFADMNTGANNISLSGISESEKKEKTRAEKKEELKQKRLDDRRKKIEKILKKVENSSDFSLLDSSEIKKLSKFKNSEISDVLMSKGFREIEISDSLEDLNKEEELQVRDFFSWISHHENHSLRKQDQILLTKISPDVFLKKYIKGYKKNRKRYFSALGKLNRTKAETFAFVQNLEPKKIKQISENVHLTQQEQEVLLSLHQETLEMNTKGIFSIFTQRETNKIQDAKHSAFEKSQEFSNEAESSEKNAQNKEAEMLKIVQKSLGKKTSQEISGKMRRGKENKQKRIQIFFEELNRISQEKIKKLKDLESEELIGAVGDSRNFYLSLINIADFSEAEKKEALTNMNSVYAVFSDFFSGKQNTDFADFYFKNEALSEAEKNDIHLIENAKSEIQIELFKMYEEYSTLISTLNNADRNDVINSEFFKDLYKKYGVNIKRLKAFAKNGEPLQASYFPHISKKLHSLGFSSVTTINDLVENPENIHNAVDKKVITHWFKKVGGAESSGFMSISKNPSTKIMEFYASSPTQKKKKMLQKFFTVERKIGNKLSNSRKLSGISLEDDLRNEYSEKMSPTFIQEQFAQVKKELRDTFSLLNGEEYLEAQSLQKFLRNEIDAIPSPTLEEIQKNNGEFSEKLTDLLKKGADKNIILEGLQDFGARNYIGYLQDQKHQMLQQKEEGTLKYFLKNNLTEQAKKQLTGITNSVQSLKNTEKTISIQEQNFIDFIKKFSKISGKFSSGSFEIGDIKNLLEVKNTNGEFLVIPLSRTDKPIEKFESESDSGIIFDPQSGHIIVSDELYREMQEFPEISHIRVLSHEIGHLWANKSNLEKNARKLLKENNLLAYVEKEFLEIFPNKTGVGDTANAVEEVFSEFVSANQFGLENFSEPDFFQKNLGLGEKMSALLKMIIAQIGVENIQSLIKNSESEFLKNIELEKNEIKNTISVGKEGHGLSFSKDQKNKFQQEANEQCELQNSASEEEVVSSYSPINKNKLLRMQVDAKSQMGNIRNIFTDIEKYKKPLPQYSSYISDFLEKRRKFLEEDIEDLSVNNLYITEEEAEEIINHIKSIYDSSVDFSAQLADMLQPDDNYFVSLWADTSFLSLNDLKEMWGTAFESIKRKLDTRAKRRRGTAGDAIFSGVWPTLANEFNKDSENAEKTEVGEIQDALDNKQTPDVYDYLSGATNEDELKASLQVLSGRGMIDWNRPEITGTLFRLGSGVPFYKSDFDNPLVRNRKLKKAFIRIWGDEEMFLDMFNENDGNISSNVDKYGKEAETNVGMKNVVIEMIKDNQKGVFVDPNRYLGYVRQMAMDGKGAPSEAFFYLIYGVARGIIPIQSFNRLDALQNSYSISNYLGDGGWTVEDAQIWCKEILWDSKNNEMLLPQKVPSQSIDHWLYKNVFTDSAVYERTATNVATRGFDHDHGRLFYSVGNSGTAIDFLATDSTGSPKIKPTAYTNAVAGMMAHVSSLAAQEDDMDRESLKNIIIRQAGYFSAFDGVATGKIDTKTKHKYKFSPYNLNEKPREGRGYNENMTTRDYLEAQRDLYSSVYSKELNDFLTNIAFSSDMIGNHLDIPNKLQKYSNADKYPQINEALHLAGIPLVSSDKAGTDLYQDVIPLLFEYFLNPPSNAEHISQEEGEKNLQSILSKTRSIASGKCNPDWAIHTPGAYTPNKTTIPEEELYKDFDDVV